MRKYLICLSILLLSCGKNDTEGINFKQGMRSFVQGLSSWSRAIKPGFIIIPQNGQELLTLSGEQGGAADLTYMASIDAVGREDFLYGYDKDDEPTSQEDRDYMKWFLDMARQHGLRVLVTDYCSTAAKMDDSYATNLAEGYLSFAADHRGLDNIPTYPSALTGENSDSISDLSQVRNFLYLIDPAHYASKQAMIDAICNTNYDLLIMDLFFNDNTAFTASEVESMRVKKNGGRRMMICYMSIGEAENYRYYWKDGWKTGNPSFIKTQNPEWKGNYKVAYWDKTWQNIIFGNDDSYLKKILDAGFDGTYLDIIDAFESYENPPNLIGR